MDNFWQGLDNCARTPCLLNYVKPAQKDPEPFWK